MLGCPPAAKAWPGLPPRSPRTTSLVWGERWQRALPLVRPATVGPVVRPVAARPGGPVRKKSGSGKKLERDGAFDVAYFRCPNDAIERE